VELMEEVAKRIELEGIEAWFKLDPAELLGAEAAEYDKISDTLDVWFDSGTTHWHVLRGSHNDGHASGPRADLYLEGSDQHRGWFHSSLLTGCAIDGHPPYKALLTHGFAVDGAGRKMSKSLGNVVVPQEVTGKLGAEILRLWVASTDYSGELSISKEILDRVVEVYRRLRNTLRFLLANTADFNPATDMLPVAEWLEIDRYALALTRKLQAQAEADYAASSSTASSRPCRTSPPKTWARCTSTCSRTASTPPPPTPRRAARPRAPCGTSCSRWCADGADPVLHRRGNLAAPRQGRGRQRDAAPLPRPARPGRRGRPAGPLDGHPRHPRRRAEGDRSRARRRPGGLVAAGRSRDPRRRRNFELLASLGDDLRFVLICSKTTVVQVASDADEAIVVTPSAHKKCERCWHYRDDVGHDAAHPELCGRCTSNLHGAGEARRVA
jgi:isoleucyl-tRNA synthetase